MTSLVVLAIVLLIAVTATIEIRHTLAHLSWMERGDKQGKPASLGWRKGKRPLISLS